MPHLVDLNGQPMTWAELWQRHEAYYARERAGDREYARWVEWKLSEPPRPDWRRRA